MRRFVLLLCCSGAGVVVAAAAFRWAQWRALLKEKPQLRFKRVLADNSPAPFLHLGQLEVQGAEVVHPYAEEIRALVKDPVFCFKENAQFLSRLEDPFVWVDTREMLLDLAGVLVKQSEFAVDTEQHSTRSFLGFTALIQISTYEHDYLVDAIALHDDMDILRPAFADPSICKVFHGADSDILWLQRDFHIYVVNLFDTARACDALGKSQRSLAYLLQTYCNISTNKQFQRADWRQRPLPDDMVHYARTDAHFLLFIARRLYAELAQGSDAESASLLELAMRRSHLICLQLYEKDGIYVTPGTTAASLVAKFYQDRSSQLQDAGFRKRLRLLCEWRDELARKEDESVRFVLSDGALLELARSCPLSPASAFSRIAEVDSFLARSSEQPLPLLPSPSPVVKKHVKSLVSRLKEAVDASVADAATIEVELSKLPKSHNTDYKRLQFVKKFSCKGLVYENCRIYAGDGRLLCYCDRKKLEWYLQRGLATVVDEDVPAIRLQFEPKGRPEDENNEFYIQSKSNQCVACGESSHYLRYRIIPSCYRQHFPEYLKSHRSHDIVLLCVDCHEVAHRAAEKYKHVIAVEYDVPLFARRIVDSGGDDEAGFAVTENEDGVSPLHLRNAAMALLCHGQEMPSSRREELEMLISAYFGGRKISVEDMKAAALVGIDPRGQKRLGRKFQKVLKNRKHVKNSEDLAADYRDGMAEELSSAAKRSKVSLLGHGLHGQRVVEKIWKERGEDGIRDFIQKWRVAFVEAVRPSYLPSGWDVAHSGRREFGEYSVYKPKQETAP